MGRVGWFGWRGWNGVGGLGALPTARARPPQPSMVMSHMVHSAPSGQSSCEQCPPHFEPQSEPWLAQEDNKQTTTTPGFAYYSYHASAHPSPCTAHVSRPMHASAHVSPPQHSPVPRWGSITEPLHYTPEIVKTELGQGSTMVQNGAASVVRGQSDVLELGATQRHTHNPQSTP